jgi:hypothetical protein
MNQNKLIRIESKPNFYQKIVQQHLRDNNNFLAGYSSPNWFFAIFGDLESTWITPFLLIIKSQPLICQYVNLAKKNGLTQ